MPAGRQKRNTPAFARGLVFAIGILMVRPDSAHSIAVTLFRQDSLSGSAGFGASCSPETSLLLKDAKMEQG